MDGVSSVPRGAWRLAWLVVAYLVAHIVGANSGEVTPADGGAIRPATPQVTRPATSDVGVDADPLR